MFKKKQKKENDDIPLKSMDPPSQMPQVVNDQQPVMQPPIMIPQNQPPVQQKGAGVLGNTMQRIGIGGVQPDDRGLLDNDPHFNQPGPMNTEGDHTPRGKGQSRMRGNQDLWLLNLFFKGCAFLSYFFLPIVFPKALSYIVVLMLTALDFWIVKNIVGRKLIKMRWWFIIDDQGNERWWYESKGITRVLLILITVDCNILFQDKLVFWGSLYIYPLAWVIFCVMNVLTFAIFETSTTFVCALIGAVQLWGFRNCKNAHERKRTLRRRRQARNRNVGGPGMAPMQEQLLSQPPPQNKKYKQ